MTTKQKVTDLLNEYDMRESSFADDLLALIEHEHAAIERKDALLRQALDMLRSADAGFAVHPSIFSAIKQELAK